MRINGAALTAIRERSGLSKSRLAVLAQVSLPYLRDLESGRRKGQNPAIVKSIAEALDVPTMAITGEGWTPEKAAAVAAGEDAA